MSTPGTTCLTVPNDTSAPGSVVTAPCRFPDDKGRSELARRPACRLVLSVHDELVYEVRGAKVKRFERGLCWMSSCGVERPVRAIVSKDFRMKRLFSFFFMRGEHNAHWRIRAQTQHSIFYPP